MSVIVWPSGGGRLCARGGKLDAEGVKGGGGLVRVCPLECSCLEYQEKNAMQKLLIKGCRRSGLFVEFMRRLCQPFVALTDLGDNGVWDGIKIEIALKVAPVGGIWSLVFLGSSIMKERRMMNASCVCGFLGF